MGEEAAADARVPDGLVLYRLRRAVGHRVDWPVPLTMRYVS